MAHYETPEGKAIYIDGYLLSNLQHFKKMVLHDDLDCIILVDGGEGCLSGDSMIDFYDKNGKKFNKTIKQLYESKK